MCYNLAENQVKGLEDDEAEFLDFVSDKQSEIERAREKENEAMLEEYRVTVNIITHNLPLLWAAFGLESTIT